MPTGWIGSTQGRFTYEMGRVNEKSSWPDRVNPWVDPQVGWVDPGRPHLWNGLVGLGLGLGWNQGEQGSGGNLTL